MIFSLVYRWRIIILFPAIVMGCGESHKNPRLSVPRLPVNDNAFSDTVCTETRMVRPGVDPASASNPFQACKDAVATGEAPLIANFENCTIDVPANEGRSGYWVVFDDGTSGTLSLDAEAGAAHFHSSGWSDWGSGVNCHIAPVRNNTDNCTYNASHYAGVRLRARGKGSVILRAASVANIAIHNGGTCKRGYNCYDLPGERIVLTDAWRTIEIPFCRMAPEGWGGKAAPLDPAEIVGFHFIFYAGQPIDFWLDDFEFFTEDTAAAPVACDPPCPLAGVQYPEKIVPTSSYLPLNDELTLHTFNQETTSCGPVTRRYLQYVPRGMAKHSSAPVVMALHGSSTNAEIFQDYLAKGRWDDLAARDGFIVVYGNAAPGAHSSDRADWENTGSWRYDYYDDGQVDDVAYLRMVIDNMKSTSVIAGDNDIYLVGLSNGGGMVLNAAKQHPELFKGIAAFMPYDGWTPTPVPDLTDTGLERVMFGYAPDDPGLSKGYYQVLKDLPAKWAGAMGLPTDVIRNPVVTEIPNRVHEGKNYRGSNDTALRTRNSTVKQLDMSAPNISGKLRILVFTRGGHLWPNPVQDKARHVIERYGFRNQDLDAADAVWSFFRE